MEEYVSSEKVIEKELVRAVENTGGMCPKFIAPGMNGMPDRLVLLPCGRIGFVEVKAPGQKPRPLQVRRHEQIRALGYKVFVLDYPEEIPWIIREIGGSDGTDH